LYYIEWIFGIHCYGAHHIAICLQRIPGMFNFSGSILSSLFWMISVESFIAIEFQDYQLVGIGKIIKSIYQCYKLKSV
jgi:hypothetical protein